MRRLIWAYIRFLLRSTNEHGVHSPFVFDLVSRCFYDKTTYPEYEQLKSYRDYVKKDKTLLIVTDLGPGSHVLKSNRRMVKDIARNAGSTVRRAKLLIRLIRHLKAENILELGTSLGIASYAMYLGNPSARITTIEGCPEISAYTKKRHLVYGAEQINLVTGEFDAILDDLKPQDYDLIFIDGNHQKDSTLRYFRKLKEHVHNDSVMIFDDINWSAGMRDAWKEIWADEDVSVSIDTFFWGLIFFRKEQAKEHFNIRL